MTTIALAWQHDQVEGTLEVTDGSLTRLALGCGDGRLDGAAFALHGTGGCRLLVTVDEENLSLSAHPTMVTVRAGTHPFTFLLRDVSAVRPFSHDILLLSYR